MLLILVFKCKQCDVVAGKVPRVEHLMVEINKINKKTFSPLVCVCNLRFHWTVAASKF